MTLRTWRDMDCAVFTETQTLESLATVSENPLISLPGMAA